MLELLPTVNATLNATSLACVVAVARWLVPFVVLLLRPARGSERILWRLSILMLVGRAFDLYVEGGEFHA